MTDKQLIEIISKELRNKTQGVTEQYLTVHQPIYKDKELVISRIDRESEEEVDIVYFPVAGEKFYFKAFIEKDTFVFRGLGTEPWYRVYLTATSSTKTLTELKAMLDLTPSEGWSKGDLRANGKTTHTFSRISFLPNPEPDTFKNKLNHLLDYLETDKDGVKRLIDNSDAYISVAADIHDANGMIHGHCIDSESIQRMAKFNLSLDFDLYVSGNPFLD
jgi:hypothetical protein